jgi:hemerythrin
MNIEWKPEYSIGVPELDEDHKNLIGLLNQVIAAISSPDKKALLTQTLNAALVYTKSHFQREEEFLSKGGYPGLEEHKASHQALVQDIVRFRLGLLSGDAMSVVELHKFFSNWLISHIRSEDKKYFDFFAK